VASLVDKTRIEDSKGTDEVAHLAQSLEGHVKRKTVKQTVMTTVYGVTEYGARNQIEKQLRDQLYASEELHSNQVPVAAKYLCTHAFAKIGDLFTNAYKIKTWFSKLVYLTADAEVFAEWITPLGLPVIQPYVQPRNAASISIELSTQEGNTLMKPNKNKQSRAFAPNFIHSLDATHMMMTSFECYRAGVQFTHVHDCFWTHASTVGDMNRICRQKFVDLHSQPILQQLADHYIVNVLPKVPDDAKREQIFRHIQTLPPAGDLDLQDVIKSVYFFS
jgi:DNA-directed RNA polymerase